MQLRQLWSKSVTLSLLMALSTSCVSAADMVLDPHQIENILGTKGTVRNGEFKASWPQRELKVTVDGFSIVPEMGLTSWAAFAPHKNQVMVMGDLVLMEDEIKDVQKTALDSGLRVTAIHNHFLRDTPKIMFMHIHGMGGIGHLAQAVRKTMDKVGQIRAAKNLSASLTTLNSTFDTREIEGIIGHAGQTANGVYKIVIARPDIALNDMGAPVSAFLGFNTWAAFQGSKEKAAVCGDFAMKENEVDGVIRALVSHGIEVTAVHNHMVTESPRIFFLHYWGVGTPARLASGLKAALDQTESGKAKKPWSGLAK